MQLQKCKFFVQGDLTREEAHAKVLQMMQIIDGDNALSSLRPLNAEVDAPNDVIQVDGIKCVDVSIGSPDFVQNFVSTKASEIIRDVEKVQVVTDSLILPRTRTIPSSFSPLPHVLNQPLFTLSFSSRPRYVVVIVS